LSHTPSPSPTLPTPFDSLNEKSQGNKIVTTVWREKEHQESQKRVRTAEKHRETRRHQRKVGNTLQFQLQVLELGRIEDTTTKVSQVAQTGRAKLRINPYFL
jgi:hypothetical protein